MKVIVPLLAFCALVFAQAATARDSKEALRDHQAFCSQFVIHDPDPSVVLSRMRDCCAFSRSVHDCQMYDWGVIERW
jgi:hypothetical protein